MTLKAIGQGAAYVAAGIIAAVGVLRSGGAHGEPPSAPPAQSTISAPALTSADVAGLRSALDQANIEGMRTSIEKRIDTTEERQARAIAELRNDLRGEIRDVRRAYQTRTDVLDRRIQHFEQRFDAAVAPKKDPAHEGEQ